jgi:1-acyl-sn-glycerol-3-phosphate acyltransferase
MTTETASLALPFKTGFSPIVKSLAYPLGQFVMSRYFKQIKIIGQEHIPRSGATILAPTHRSRWDPMLVPYIAGPYVTGRDIRFMTSHNEMKGLQGWFVRRLGGFPVDTDSPSVATFKYSIDILARSEMLAIFPEGNIFREAGIQELKKGLARIALQAYSTLKSQNPSQDVQIVPITFHYSERFVKWGTKVLIAIEPPILASSYADLSSKKGAAALHDDLTKALIDSVAKYEGKLY